MDKICTEKWNIKGVDRVSPLCKACPESPKTPENIEGVNQRNLVSAFFVYMVSYRKPDHNSVWTYS